MTSDISVDKRSVCVVDLEETYCELCADLTALNLICNAYHEEGYDSNSLDHLLWDRLCLLDQHIHDIKSLCGFDL